MRRARLPTLLLLLLAGAPLRPGVAATPSPQLQRQVEAATFEVVIGKPEKDGVTYEKPLPLELVPFVERNDKYWSIGTAFAIASNTYLTAAHVILQAVGSQFGTPAIRDAAGKVYKIDRILKFSLREDFVEFSVVDPPALTSLETAAPPPLNEPIFAVGNALGEGVVIRDGLYTSQTPESQDGGWKWLRFSAAASPGNSGGPLLDLQGRVIGIVVAKSPNENLNFALPIGRVLDDSGKAAALDVRQAFAQPMVLQGRIVAQFKDSFALPLPFTQFSRSYLDAYDKYFRESQAKLLASQAPELFPRGKASVPVATLYTSFDPGVLSQQQDHSWDVRSCSTTEDRTALAGDGHVWHCRGDLTRSSLFRIQYPGTIFEAKHYNDSREFMDLLLKGVMIPRMVGTDPVRITSLGRALSDATVRDRYGRVWQQRVWSLGYADIYLVVLALPTPDGYVGLLSMAPHGLVEATTVTCHFLADYIYLSYTGSLAQWSGFLAHPELRPAALGRVRLQYAAGKGVQIQTPRWNLDSTGVLAPGEHSTLGLLMGYVPGPAGEVTWEAAGAELLADRDGKTEVAVRRQPQPGDDAGEELRTRWQHMSHREQDFNGQPRPLGGHVFEVQLVAGDEVSAKQTAVAGPLYELQYVSDSVLVPRDMTEAASHLRQGFQVRE